MSAGTWPEYPDPDAPPRRLFAPAEPPSLTPTDHAAIRTIVREELRVVVAELFGDPADPTDGPLDQVALRLHRDTVDVVNAHTTRATS